MKLMVNRRSADVRLTPNYGGQPLLASHLSRDPFNRPAGTGQFSSCLQALRAWLRSCCPSGTKYILPAEALIKLAFTGLKPCTCLAPIFRPEAAQSVARSGQNSLAQPRVYPG